MKALRSRLSYSNVISTIALFLALGGGAYAVTGSESDPPQADSAQIPTRGGTIIGCYNRRTGALRAVSSSRRCRRGRERVLRWAQRGRQGQPGTPADTSAFYTKGETDSRFLPLNGTAQNASLLEGLRATAFEDASTIVSGKADQTSASRLTVLEVPAVGVRLLTDGDGASDGGMRVQSMRSSGTLTMSSGAVLNPGETSPEAAPDEFGGATTSNIWRQIVTADPTGRFVALECWMTGATAQCVAAAG